MWERNIEVIKLQVVNNSESQVTKTAIGGKDDQIDEKNYKYQSPTTKKNKSKTTRWFDFFWVAPAPLRAKQQ